MASKEDISRTYDWMSPLFRKGIGETADFTCAFYNGDYSLTLEQAQKAKHDFILEIINFKPGTRVLDIGCGWGPMLKAVQDRSGKAVGITLSPAQVSSCRSNGLEAHLKDWKDLKVGEYGDFDAVIAVGSLEHFCSKDEYIEGKQDEIYRRFFELCYKLLPPQGRLFLQTFVWDKVPPVETISLNAPKGSNERYLALMEKFWPGSWLPYGKEQLIKDAHGFKLKYASSGREDYKVTIDEWAKRVRPSRTWQVYITHGPQLLWRFVTDKDFRYGVECSRNGGTKESFLREIMDHYRMAFEKVPPS